MSAAEKLKALDQAAVGSPWLAEDDGVSVEPFVLNLAHNPEDRSVIAILRNALPQIAAAVELGQAYMEHTEDQDFRMGHMNTSCPPLTRAMCKKYTQLRTALAALDEKLGDVT